MVSVFTTKQCWYPLETSCWFEKPCHLNRSELNFNAQFLWPQGMRLRLKIRVWLILRWKTCQVGLQMNPVYVRPVTGLRQGPDKHVQVIKQRWKFRALHSISSHHKYFTYTPVCQHYCGRTGNAATMSWTQNDLNGLCCHNCTVPSFLWTQALSCFFLCSSILWQGGIMGR